MNPQTNGHRGVEHDLGRAAAHEVAVVAPTGVVAEDPAVVLAWMNRSVEQLLLRPIPVHGIFRGRQAPQQRVSSTTGPDGPHCSSGARLAGVEFRGARIASETRLPEEVNMESRVLVVQAAG